MAGRNIRGPHSALTDFLASHNISAAEIRDSYLRRVRDAERDGQQNGEQSTRRQSARVAAAATQQENAQDGEGDEGNQEEEDGQEEGQEVDDEEVEAVVAQSRSGRKRKSQAAQEKAKAAKKKKQQKKQARRNGDEDDEDVSDSGGEFLPLKKQALPGQLSNCETCDKRFTVTPYSKTGPAGGLLCTACSKELIAEEKKGKAKVKKPARKGRRQNFSNILDGIVPTGAPSLVELCVKRVADNIHDVEEFGDLPDKLLHRLSQILSKRRVLTSRTLDMFLRREFDFIEIFDCAKLEEEDFEKIFALMPNLTKVDFRCAGQMKDPALEYLMTRECHIKHLCLDACNLISDDCWKKFFEACGPQLEVLKLSNLDCSMGDETVAYMVKHCPNLRCLKLKECWKPSNKSLKSIGRLEQLEHVSLGGPQYHVANPYYMERLVLRAGKNLRTLSFGGFKYGDDGVIALIHQECRHLTKLRITGGTAYQDRSIAALFTNWENPGLSVIDFSGTRHLDSTQPEGPPDFAMGLASDGFQALMAHSGRTIRKLNISSCRHISYEAFTEVFTDDADADGESKTYPCLEELDVSFHTVVDDVLLARVFRCCPALKKVIAFACFQVRDVKVPPRVALIGGVNAHRSLGE